MGLGEKLRQARLEQGLSQRQLCGEEITRNMLSQIENGSASPSVATLCYLARRLGKSVSYFLEEEAHTSDFPSMERAWQLFAAGDYTQVLDTLDCLQEEGREGSLLRSLTLQAQAEEAFAERKTVYALACLEKSAELEEKLAFLPELTRRRLLLLARIPGWQGRTSLPELDGELLYQASVFLNQQAYEKAMYALEIAENQTSCRWQLLRGQAAMGLKDYIGAEKWLTEAEAAYPEIVLPLLEQCFREQGKYEKAYYCAVRQREMS